MKNIIYFLGNLILGVFAFSFSSALVFAVPPTILSNPSSIDVDNSFTLSATMSGLSNNTIYRLRITFAKTETPDYFGSTFNGTDWYNGTPSPINYSNFLTVTTDDNGAWGGDILGKVETSDPNFTTGSGTYDVKIGRYTQSGTNATWSNIVPISLVAPTPTPTPSPTPSPAPTSTPVPAPTKTPTHTLIPNTPTPTLKPLITPTKTPIPSREVLPTSVLGESTESGTILSPTNKPFNEVKRTNNNLQKVLVGVGIVFIVVCAILTFRAIKKGKLRQDG